MVSSNGLVDYFTHSRPELHGLVPQQARTLLDVGCAGGQFGAALRESRSHLKVWGVELNVDAAAQAAQTYEQVFVGPFPEAMGSDAPTFDCIAFNDVLEHMIDPWAALRASRDFLSDNGVVIVSLPNVCSAGVIAQLLGGEFNYADSGVLDRTHLRFFTPKTAIGMIEGAGFRILESGYSWPHVGRWVARLLHKTPLGRFNERQLIFVLGRA